MTVSLIGYSSFKGKKDPNKTWVSIHCAYPRNNFVGNDVFSTIFDSSLCPEILDIKESDFPVDLDITCGFNNRLESLIIL